jgi:hypothetical protein
MMQERERTLGYRLDDEREAIGQIIARTAVELHPFVVLTGYDPKPVVLDFVQPRSPEGGCGALVGRHGATKPAGRTRGRNDMASR